jgi:hypothetical protein
MSKSPAEGLRYDPPGSMPKAFVAEFDMRIIHIKILLK